MKVFEEKKVEEAKETQRQISLGELEPNLKYLFLEIDEVFLKISEEELPDLPFYYYIDPELAETLKIKPVSHQILTLPALHIPTTFRPQLSQRNPQHLRDSRLLSPQQKPPQFPNAPTPIERKRILHSWRDPFTRSQA